MKVTFCLTSCGRQDLLERTLDTFLKYNTYPIERYIVSEDSGITGINDELQKKYPFIEFINDGIKQGQIKSIDSMYSQVTTPYIFHCEDDWEFYRSGFIEESLKVLGRYPKVINFWLREKNDTNGHPILYNSTLKMYQLRLNHSGWHGFTFNPTLKRVEDYKRLGSYSDVAKFNPHDPASAEKRIGEVYKNMGYIALIGNSGYVRHIGWGKKVKPAYRMAIVIPYRDRQEHLNRFIEHYRKIFKKDIDIFIIEQTDEQPFNRAKLFNVFFLEYGHNYDYYAFHDVDMYLDTNRTDKSVYDYPEVPTHIATRCEQFGYKMPYSGYFGGVILISRDDFKRSGGFSNNFWGWGGEDDEMKKNILAKGMRIASRQAYFFCANHERKVDRMLHRQNLTRLRGGRDKCDGYMYCQYRVVATIITNDYICVKTLL